MISLCFASAMAQIVYTTNFSTEDDFNAWTSHADDVNASNDTLTTSVLHKAPATIPYTMGFESSEYTDGITFFNLNEVDGIESIVADDVLVRVSANVVTVVGVEVRNIVICDMNGRDVATVNSNEISTEGLNSGIYILKITTSDNVITKKIVIK